MANDNSLPDGNDHGRDDQHAHGSAHGSAHGGEKAGGGEHEQGTHTIKQCDPGVWDYRLYTFMQGSTKIADMLVARTSDPNRQYAVGTEYWMMTSVPSPRLTTTVSMVDNPWSAAPPDPRRVSFTMAQGATWASGPPVISTDPLLVNADSTIGIQWRLAQSSGVWSGSIIWSRYSSTGTNMNTLFAGAAATQTFTLVSSVPSRLNYNATCYVNR